MIAPLRLIPLALMLTLTAFQPMAQAWDWSKPKLKLKLPRQGGKANAARHIAPRFEPKRIRVAEFTGGTGASAQKELTADLAASREFVITGVDADYTISGTSAGGRVTGILKDTKGKVLLERTYAAPGLDENLKSLSDDIIYAITGRPGLATSRLVFVSNRTGAKQIYICDHEGKDVQQVTRHAYGAVAPSLSPDGTLLAFTSYRSGFPVVLLLDLGAGFERTVTDTPGTSFGAAFSPSGQQLAMVMSFLGNPEVFVSDLSSNTAGCISDTIGVPSSPAWHPDGKHVIFSDDRGQGSRLYITRVPEKQGREEAELLLWRTGYNFCTDPEWSPDGRSIACTAISGGEKSVIVKEYPNGPARKIQGNDAQHPSWSPNGRYLAYVQHGALYIHDLTTNQRRVVLSGYGQISEPRWMR